jgi:hypothetical protein
MPRLYFHLHNQISARDEEGRDLADPSTAWMRAVEDIRSIVSEEARSGQLDLRGRIEIADEGGQVLSTVQFIEAFELALPENPA